MLLQVVLYANGWMDLKVRLPELLPTPRVDAAFSLTLKAGDSILAENTYDLILATRAWSMGEMPSLALYDPHHVAPTVMSADSSPSVSLATTTSADPSAFCATSSAWSMRALT